jgi:hypothetical protein
MEAVMDAFLTCHASSGGWRYRDFTGKALRRKATVKSEISTTKDIPVDTHQPPPHTILHTSIDETFLSGFW